MANEIIPDEGLDFWLAVMLKSSAAPATTYCGLFTSQTATTTPANTAVLATQTGVAESTTLTSYARQPIAAGSWGAVGVKTVWSQTTRGITASQVTFPAAGGVYGTAINGFFLSNLVTIGGGIGLMYSNFDDQTAIASLALGDIIKITPTFGLLG